jgi:hypothetical protein
MAFASMFHYRSRLDSAIEFMNQVAAYLACLMLYLMTDYVTTNEEIYFFGWGLIGLVCIFVAVNILIQLGVFGRSACSNFRRWWTQYQRKEKS